MLLWYPSSAIVPVIYIYIYIVYIYIYTVVCWGDGVNISQKSTLTNGVLGNLVTLTITTVLIILSITIVSVTTSITLLVRV